MKRRLGIGLTAGLALTTLASVAGVPGAAHAAQAKPGHTALVPVSPRTNTPRIGNGEIWDFETIGNTVYVAGSFTSMRNAANGSPTINQSFLMSYDLTTGLINSSFNPVFDGQVLEVEASPDGTKLFVAGQFNTINGVTKRKIARIDPVTGAPVAGFTAQANGRATALAVTNTAVYAGGQFTMVNSTARSALVKLNPNTGAVDTAFNVPVTGGIGVGGLLTVQRLKLSHDETKLLVLHTGRQMAGQDRYGVGLIDTTTNALLPWQTSLWQDNLVFVGGVMRGYAADISPDDSYFVVTSGSGGDRPPINDTAVAFSLNGGAGMQPLWVTRDFDSTYSVAITEKAVYIGGHFSATESPTASDPWPGLTTTGYGTGQGPGGLGPYVLGDEVVRRSELAALDPATGHALEWNPGANANEGVKALEATSRGLLYGGDSTTVGGQNIGRIGIFDLTTVPAQNAADTDIVFPYDGQVVPANTPFDLTGTATTTAGTVKNVVLEIIAKGSKNYLQDDLVTWSSSYNSINAVLATPNAVSTNWSLHLSVPTTEVQVYARTTSSTGVKDSTKAYSQFEARSLDDAAPTTSFSLPAAGLLTSQTFTVSGIATDDKGINGLSYWMRDQDTMQYLQDDGTLGATFNTFHVDPDVIGATNATWHTDITVPVGGVWRMNISSSDTSGQTDLKNNERTWTVDQTGVAPTISIATPAVMVPPTAAAPITVASGQTLTFTGTATDDAMLTSVQVSLRNTTTGEALATDGSWGNVVSGYYRVSPLNLNTNTYNWTFTSVPLSAGIYDFRVTATDDLGLTSAAGRLAITAQVPGDAFPNTALTFAGTDQNTEVLHLNIAGTATDDHGVANVKVKVQDLDTTNYVTAAGTFTPAATWIDVPPAAPGATSTSFLLSLDLPSQGEYQVTAVAVDTVGQLDGATSGAVAKYLVYPGDLDPALNPALDTPANGATQTGAIVVGGRAEDDHGISNVQVSIKSSANKYMSSAGTFTTNSQTWIATFLTSPGTPGSNFNYTSPVVPPGVYTVSIRATDNWGQLQQTPRVFTVTVI